MTILELVERDLKKAEINLCRAKNRPNIPKSELDHHEELLSLRTQICVYIKSLSEGGE